MSEIEQIAKTFRVQNYGNLIRSDSPVQDKTGIKWTVNLKSLYPRFIVDDSEPPVRELYFVTFNQLGNITLDLEGKVISSTPREVVINRLNDYKNIWKNRVENAIIKACSSYLVFSPTIKYFLNPLRRVVNTIMLTGKITFQELKWFPNTSRAYEWSRLLLESQIISEYENGYQYGDMWSGFYERANSIRINDEDEYHDIFRENLPSFNRHSIFEHLVMSYILEDNFPYIQDVMNLTQMNTVVNTNNTFYRPCLESRRLLTFTPNSIVFNYNKFYPDQKLALISSSIMELVSVGLLTLEDGQLSGNKNRLNKMLELGPAKQVSLSA